MALSRRLLLSREGILACLALAAVGAAYLLLPKAEASFEVRPLASFTDSIGPWRMVQQYQTEAKVQDVLRADDTMNRTYAAEGQPVVSLFVAFFRSQRTGVAPHSPKNCLPGSGWAPLESGYRAIPVRGAGRTIEVNRYMVAREADRQLVYYWYQTPYRAVASEYAAKFWLVADSIMHRRSDTSLVRVVVPLRDSGEDAADRAAQQFLQDVYPALAEYLPH
jgi:EpsI family protein